MKLAIYDEKVFILDDERKEVVKFRDWSDVNDFIRDLKEMAQKQFGNDWSHPRYDD